PGLRGDGLRSLPARAPATSGRPTRSTTKPGNSSATQADACSTGESQECLCGAGGPNAAPMLMLMQPT
ncbi:MAG: hypothetical protein ACXWIQ_01670, partial [Caldimonas sp.]